MENSPYTPGAGHQPPALAGRDDLVRFWAAMLADLQKSGRPRAADTILSGPRGTGKTAMLTGFHRIAVENGYDVVVLQAVRDRGGLIDGLMARANDRILDNNGAWTRAKSALERAGGVTLGLPGASAPGSVNSHRHVALPDAGVVANGLAELAHAVRALHFRGGLLISVDELQVADPDDLALLANTLHRLNVEHPSSPVAFAATGLPNTLDVLNAAGVTHPHRLFDEHPIELQLDAQAARFAVSQPAVDRGVTWDADALSATVEASDRYPAHIQEFAHAAWCSAAGPSAITMDDASAGIRAAGVRIERREVEPRWADASDREVEFLAALALAGGTASSRHIGAVLGRAQPDWRELRAGLVAAGDVYPLSGGRLAFALPTYARYVLANYPERRATASVRLLSLLQMRSNLATPQAPHSGSQTMLVGASGAD